MKQRPTYLGSSQKCATILFDFVVFTKYAKRLRVLLNQFSADFNELQELHTLSLQHLTATVTLQHLMATVSLQHLTATVIDEDDSFTDCRYQPSCRINFKKLTRSSAVAEKPRDASCLTVVSFYSAVFYNSYSGFRFNNVFCSVLFGVRVEWHKKLSYRREAVRCLVLLSIFVSRWRLL